MQGVEAEVTVILWFWLQVGLVEVEMVEAKVRVQHMLLVMAHFMAEVAAEVLGVLWEAPVIKVSSL